MFYYNFILKKQYHEFLMFNEKMKEKKEIKWISTLSPVFHFYIPKYFRVFDTGPVKPSRDE